MQAKTAIAQARWGIAKILKKIYFFNFLEFWVVDREDFWAYIAGFSAVASTAKDGCAQTSWAVAHQFLMVSPDRIPINRDTRA
jgi:hypothetical protein